MLWSKRIMLGGKNVMLWSKGVMLLVKNIMLWHSGVVLSSKSHAVGQGCCIYGARGSCYRGR